MWCNLDSFQERTISEAEARTASLNIYRKDQRFTFRGGQRFWVSDSQVKFWEMKNWLERDSRTWLQSEQSAGISALAFSDSVFLVSAIQQPDISVAPFPLQFEVSPARGRSHKGKYSSSRLHGRNRAIVMLCISMYFTYFRLTKRDAVVGVIIQTATDTADFSSKVGTFTGASQMVNRALNHLKALLTP